MPFRHARFVQNQWFNELQKREVQWEIRFGVAAAIRLVAALDMARNQFFKVLTDWLVRWVITDLWPKQWLRVKVQYTVTMLKQRGAHMVPQSAKKMKPRR